VGSNPTFAVEAKWRNGKRERLLIFLLKQILSPSQ
jgi:hypothetical protein